MKRKHRFIQSKYWWCVKDLDWLIENAEFVYNHNYHNGHRPHIKIKMPFNDTGCDVVQLDNDKWGILVKGTTTFNDTIGKCITESSKDVEKFIVDFFMGYGCEEFIDPKPEWFRRLLQPDCKIV